MADKKPVYNPSTTDDATVSSSTASTNDAGTRNASSSRRKLGAGAIVGISAAALALLIGTSVAGSAITLAIAHNDRGHSAEGALGGHDGDRDGGQMPGGMDGDRDGDRDGGPGRHGVGPDSSTIPGAPGGGVGAEQSGSVTNSDAA